MQIKELYRTIKTRCQEKGINPYKTDGYFNAKKLVEQIGDHDIESLIAGMQDAGKASQGAKDEALNNAMGAFIAYYEAYDKDVNK